MLPAARSRGLGQTGVVTIPDPVERPYDAARHAADALAAATGADRHDLLVVLGSGWAPAAAQIVIAWSGKLGWPPLLGLIVAVAAGLGIISDRIRKP